MPVPSGSRFYSLQKRLERRNNSLRPSYNHSSRLEDRSLLTIEERKKEVPEDREVIPELIQSSDTCSTEHGSRIEVEEKEIEKPPKETSVDPLIERMRQIVPSTTGYLPVAMPRSSACPDYPVDAKDCVDAEESYRTLFNAPSHIELRRRATFDDGITEVSEITADGRGLSTKGAFYAESRLAGMLQKRLENPRLGIRTFTRRGPPGEHNLSLSQSNSYVEVDVNDLSHLNEAVEKAKLDLQRGITPVNVVPRHGLPYEATDFRAEGDDEESDDIWDGAILDSHGQRQQRIQSSLDPVDGDVLCVQGPPTPRDHHLSPKASAKTDHLQNLIVETLSSEGDIVIDTTEIRDEDIDGVIVLDGNTKNHDETSVEASILFGEHLLVEAATEPEDAGLRPLDKAVRCSAGQTTSTKKAAAKSPKKSKARRISRSRSQNSDAFKSKSPKASDEVRSKPQYLSPAGSNAQEEESATAGLNSSYEKYYIQDKRNSRDDQRSVFFQPGQNVEAMASDLYSSSLGYFKSFVGQVNAQLKYIQRRGLINENEMDGMLEVLEQGIEETSKKLPEESEEAVIFLGEELERNTCGIDRSIGNHGTEIEFPSESVERMLDSLKSAYQKSLKTCGVDKTMMEENIRAMEKMVSNLKLSYHKNAVACGKREDVVDVSGRCSDLFSEADKLVWDFPATAPNSGALVPSREPLNLLLGDISSSRHRSKSSDPAVASAVGVKAQDTTESYVAQERNLREKSAEAVEEMLSSAKESYGKKMTNVKTRRRRNAPFRESQTFIVPITMPVGEAPTSSAFSAIE